MCFLSAAIFVLKAASGMSIQWSGFSPGQQQLHHAVRLEALLDVLGVGQRVAGQREDGVDGGLAGQPVVAVRERLCGTGSR